nr:hypothetical protein [bacterium]
MNKARIWGMVKWLGWGLFAATAIVLIAVLAAPEEPPDFRGVVTAVEISADGDNPGVVLTVSQWPSGGTKMKITVTDKVQVVDLDGQPADAGDIQAGCLVDLAFTGKKSQTDLSTWRLKQVKFYPLAAQNTAGR